MVQSMGHANLSMPIPELSRQSLLDSLTTGVLQLDSSLTVLDFNPACQDLLAFPGQRVRGRDLADLLPRAVEWLELLQRSAADQQGYTLGSITLPLGTEGKIERQVGCTVSPEDDKLLVELIPLDRRKAIRSEDSLTAQQDARRMLMSGLAHEVKNPLGGIRGAAQLLDAELDKRELREYTSIIIAEADRLSSLADKLLGPVGALKLAPRNVHQLLDRVSKLLATEFTTAVVFQRDYDPSLPDLMLDGDQIIQVFMNILRNACQAVPVGGTIRLLTRVERQFTIRQQLHRLVARIDVIDDGPGILPTLQEMLFYPLVSGRPDGTGLGLAIAQDIVNRHGGLIKAKSKPGETIFSIYLPTSSRSDEQ
ncbi:MAG: nitrogen regulation protein NR(II) [Gammaproteobacteria bacterium]